jgi:hypothetical protein
MIRMAFLLSSEQDQKISFFSLFTSDCAGAKPASMPRAFSQSESA